MADLDRGGTVRQWTDQYLGPSIGWVKAPARNILSITAAGTYIVDRSINIVQVNVNGLVTVQLWQTAPLVPPAGVNPELWVLPQVLVEDIGGFAQANNITVNPFGAETIDGLATVAINSNYGSLLLQPNPAIPGWTV